MNAVTRDNKDVVAGAVVMLIGGAVCVHSMMTLDAGTFAEMGPGMFPIMVGLIMFALGAGIFFPAFKRNGTLPVPDLRSAAAVIAALVVFGLLIGHLGVVPAVVATTLVASRADSKLSVVKALSLGLFLGALSSLLLIYVIQLPIAAFSMDF